MLTSTHHQQSPPPANKHPPPPVAATDLHLYLPSPLAPLQLRFHFVCDATLSISDLISDLRFRSSCCEVVVGSDNYDAVEGSDVCNTWFLYRGTVRTKLMEMEMDAKTETLDAVAKEAVDLENVPIEEVFQTLRCNSNGLTIEAAKQRLTIFGYNKLEEKQESKVLKFLGFMGKWNPLSWVMEAAAIMAIALAHGRSSSYHGYFPFDKKNIVSFLNNSCMLERILSS